MKTAGMHEFVDEALCNFAFLRHRPSEADIENALATGQGITIHEPKTNVDIAQLSHMQLRTIVSETEDAIFGVDMDTPLSEVRRRTLDAFERRSNNERLDAPLREWGENPEMYDVARLIHAIRNPPVSGCVEPRIFGEQGHGFSEEPARRRMIQYGGSVPDQRLSCRSSKPLW